MGRRNLPRTTKAKRLGLASTDPGGTSLPYRKARACHGNAQGLGVGQRDTEYKCATFVASPPKTPQGGNRYVLGGEEKEDWQRLRSKRYRILRRNRGDIVQSAQPLATAQQLSSGLRTLHALHRCRPSAERATRCRRTPFRLHACASGCLDHERKSCESYASVSRGVRVYLQSEPSSQDPQSRATTASRGPSCPCFFIPDA